MDCVLDVMALAMDCSAVFSTSSGTVRLLVFRRVCRTEIHVSASRRLFQFEFYLNPDIAFLFSSWRFVSFALLSL